MMNKLMICMMLSCLLLGCEKQLDTEIEGYIEGDFTYLAAPFAGTLQELSVERGAAVKAGDTLFKLDIQPQVSELKQTEQQLSEAKASLRLAELRLTRAKQLIKHDATAQDALDEAQANYSKQLAYLKQAQALLTKLNWTIEQKVGLAPTEAMVFDTYYRNGELVAKGQPVVSLLAPNDIHAVAYVPEGLLGRLNVGGKLSLSCDSCQQPATVTIDYISPKAEYTPPVIYSRSNNHKLIYRIEAKPDKPSPHLHPGQPVYLSLPNTEN